MQSTRVTGKIIDFSLKSLSLHVNFLFFLRPTCSLELIGIICTPRSCNINTFVKHHHGWSAGQNVFTVSSSVTIQHGLTALQCFLDSLTVGSQCSWEIAVSESYSTKINRGEGSYSKFCSR